MKRSSSARQESKDNPGTGIGLLDVILPFMIPIKGMVWISSKLRDMAEDEITDKSTVHEELLNLQMRFEMGEIEEGEYNRKETRLLERLEAIRKYEEAKRG